MCSQLEGRQNIHPSIHFHQDKTVVSYWQRYTFTCLLPYVMQGGRHDQRCYNRLLIIYFQATFHAIGILRPLSLAFALVTFTQTLHYF